MSHPAPRSVEDLITDHVAAQMTGLSTKTLAHRRIRGDGPPFVRLGRTIRYRPADVVDWIDAHVIGTSR